MELPEVAVGGGGVGKVVSGLVEGEVALDGVAREVASAGAVVELVVESEAGAVGTYLPGGIAVGCGVDNGLQISQGHVGAVGQLSVETELDVASSHVLDQLAIGVLVDEVR